MSINTITPTFNNHISSDLIDLQSAACKAQDLNNDLNFKRDRKDSSHGAAARIVRNIADDKEFKVASAEVDSLDYFDNLLKGEC